MPADDAAVVTLACCAFALAIRAMVGLAGYSGEHTPPMYGDFECQRHWMEITVNLPPRSWYVHGPDNDLQYWGIDYPPLSAHHSYLLGKLARAAGHPALVELYSSRGHESPATRAFMRNVVLLCDALIFFTAAASFVHAVNRHRGGVAAQASQLLQILLVPVLVLVDHGHFQFNCVSLGLTMWAAHLALSGRPLACCVCFSLALNFKQMTLYLAPAFFCYLLAGCLHSTPTILGRLGQIARLGVAVVGTFILCWYPFLTSTADALAVVRRVFPVERHLYEDKVANLWCTLSLLPMLKLKAAWPIAALLRLSLATTLAALLPPCVLLVRRPSRLGFLLCATACGLAFFLCSYQVHEKHILLPLLPASMLAHRQPALFGWLATASCFSLYPLLKRDGQAVQYAVLQVGYLALCKLAAAPLPRIVRLAMGVSLAGMLVLHILDATLNPPARYPDLHAVAFAGYSCLHFVLAYAVAVGVQFAAATRLAGKDEHTPMHDSAGHTDLIFMLPGHPPNDVRKKAA